MDKNQATGLILFAAVILIYSIFFASGPEVPMTENEVAVQTVDTASVASPEKTPVLAENDSIVEAGKVAKFGVLAGMTQGSEELVNLENDKVFISISSKGGLIKEVILKEYKNWTQEPLKLLDEESSKMDFSL